MVWESKTKKKKKKNKQTKKKATTTKKHLLEISEKNKVHTCQQW